jgi:predicted transcriptional regulator
MVRAKITAYVPPDLADALKRVAAIKDRSVSDIVEDAIAKTLMGASRDAEHAALMAKLNAMQRRLGVIERSQETLFEFSAHAARFSMSVTPDIAEADRANANARGAERFRGIIAAIVARLGAGKSVWKDHFPAMGPAEGNGAHANGAVRNGSTEAAHD